MQEGRVLHLCIGHHYRAVQLKNPQCVTSWYGRPHTSLGLGGNEGVGLSLSPWSAQKGVGSIDYCPEYAGNTVGFEKTIHVWLRWSKALMAIWRSCSLQRQSTVCVCDELSIVRVWAFRFMSCTEIITRIGPIRSFQTVQLICASLLIYSTESLKRVFS